MMRLLKPLRLTDAAWITRICGHWLREELDLQIVEYRIGNAFTGSIDILAVDAHRVYLVTVNTARLGDALFEALTGYRWFLENREFLDRVHGTGTMSLLRDPVLMLLSPDFPPGVRQVFLQTLKVDVRLFRYMVMGSEEQPEFYVEELFAAGGPGHADEEDLNGIRMELAIDRAGLSDEEIREFLAVMRSG